MYNNDFEVRIIQDKREIVLRARRGRRLKELFSDAGISFAYPCAGNGRCGKCVISFDKGAPSPGDIDKNFLSEAELDAGKRILCRCILEKECVIRVGNSADEENIAVENVGNSFVEDKEPAEGDKVIGDASKYNGFGIAIDLGTTTIAAVLVGLGTEDVKSAVLRTASSVNHQRRYGADVISRIEAASDSEVRKELQRTAQKDIAELIGRLLSGMDISISRICIAGNTTMLHLLRGYDVSGLGSFPYKPVTTYTEHLGIKELLGEEADDTLVRRFSDTSVTLMPGISAFVGADIVAGIYGLDMINSEGKRILFVDLGTNGEMAYFDGTSLTVTSTAAGPVFEGGGISCGVPSVPGAVSHVSITKGDDEKYNIDYETIGDKRAFGLCGTGVIEAVSELAMNEIVDKNGLLSEEFFENGFVIDPINDIRITQKDIRNVQLAKAAIRTGIERLLDGEDSDKIYIAGGFGTNIDVTKLRFLNMIPDRLLHKIIPAGNTSLKGCIRYLEENSLDETGKITSLAKEITLAMEDGFGEDYVASMGF